MSEVADELEALEAETDAGLQAVRATLQAGKPATGPRARGLSEQHRGVFERQAAG